MKKIKKGLLSAIAVCMTAAIGITALANGTGSEPGREEEGMVPGFSLSSPDSNLETTISIPGQAGLEWTRGLTNEEPPTYDFGTRSDAYIPPNQAPQIYLYNGSGEKVVGVKITSDSPDADCFQIIGPGAGGGEDYIDSDNQTIPEVGYALLPRSAFIKEERAYSATYTIGGTTEKSNKYLSLSVTLTLVYDDSKNPNYKVSFDSQGGTYVAPQYASNTGDYPISEPPPPTRDGYIFDGWYTEPECTAKWNFDNNITQRRMTLYAKWSPDGDVGETYTVTYDSAGGTVIAPVTGVKSGSKLNAPPVPKKDGFVFDGWYKDSTCNTAWNFSADTVTSNITLFAKWKEASVGAFEYIKQVSAPSNGSLWITWDTDKKDDQGNKIAITPSDCDITYVRANDPPKELVIDDFFQDTAGKLGCTYKTIPQTNYAQVVKITVKYKGQTEGKSDSFVVEPGTGSITPEDGKCTVVLKNKNGTPIEGAKISMIASGDVRTDVITDANGEAPFQLDPKMNYILLAEKSGYHKVEWPPRSIGQVWNVFMEPTSSSSSGSGYCNFTVVDENQNPIPDSRIEFRCPGDNTSGNGMTDSKGQSRILVNKNTYELTVIKDGYENYKAIFPVMSAEQSLKIQLKPGISMETPDFTSICTVNTMVRDTYGNPVPNANISLICPADNQIGKSVSSSSGMSSPPVYIRSNNYILTVSKTGYEKYEKDVVVTGDEKTFNVVLTPISQIGGNDFDTILPPSGNTNTNNTNNNTDRTEKPSSNNSSSTSKPSKPSGSAKNPVVSSKVDPDTVAQKTTEAIKEQLKTSSSSVPVVNVKNPGPISPEALKSMAETAKHSNTKVQLQADSVDENGNVTARLYIDPAKAGNITKDIELGVSVDPEKTKETSETFEKYFDNEISVVHFDQKGSFGMTIDVAVKVDLSKLDTKTLQFYSYDSLKNTYAPVTVSSYYVDANGYLHFPTGVGNNIVITDKALTPKK